MRANPRLREKDRGENPEGFHGLSKSDSDSDMMPSGSDKISARLRRNKSQQLKLVN